MNTYEPVTLKLSKDEALVLTNSLIDMKNYYMNDGRQHDGMAQPYIDLLKDLSAIKNNDNKITLVGGGLECAEYALRHTDNGKANPDISDRLINRMNGMAVREDFSYDINRNSSEYVCRVYYKDNPFHAFGGAVHRGHIDMKALTENVEATINMKIAEINKDFNKAEGKETQEPPIYRYEMAIATHGRLPEGKDLDTAKYPDNFHGNINENGEISGALEFRCTVIAHNDEESKEKAEEKWEKADFGDLEDIQTGHWNILTKNEVKQMENGGLRKIYEVKEDKALENEYNLFATAYLTFNDDNEMNLDNCMVANGYFNENVSAVYMRPETISFLQKTYRQYADRDLFINAVNEYCPVLSDYAQQAVLIVDNRSQLMEMMIDEMFKKTQILFEDDEPFTISVQDYTIEGFFKEDDEGNHLVEYRLWKGDNEIKYDNCLANYSCQTTIERFVDSIAEEIDINKPENGILVGRPVEGISLNGDEFLLDNKGNPLVFNSIEQAKDFLINKGGYDEVNLEEINFYDANEELKKWDNSKNNDGEGKKKASKEQKSDFER